VRKKLRFVKVWAWPKDIEALISANIRPLSLHVCSGHSKLGDVKLDLYEGADVKGDMFHLPFRDKIFNTVICDPPWKLPIHLRPKLLFELRDKVRPKGILILNAPFVPPIPKMKRVRTYLIQRSTWRNLRVVSIYRRLKEAKKVPLAL